ncbi:hypothetical protein [Parenemella sanctibonifatiensis]|uniref:DUF4352 domain-containing protein n=1 Tax=Parenemella sanctibonifatiensis TaxID=2016505 RepID=A0A255EG92_9ACTN|nr:hypothetical protein [Parenemella sanctibonifatiensis]OYN90280.1 hypothetical protein CGZ91_08960 [Parenemella sanctibonifatiensis]
MKLSAIKAGGRTIGWSGVIVALVCVLLTGWALQLTPDGFKQDSRATDIGEPFEVEGSTWTVAEVRYAGFVTVGQTVLGPTQDVYVAVLLTLSAGMTDFLQPEVYLQTTDDVERRPVRRPPMVVPAGYTGGGWMIFEVPANRLAGAKITAVPAATMLRFPPQLVVDLGLDQSAVDDVVAQVPTSTADLTDLEVEPQP